MSRAKFDARVPVRRVAMTPPSVGSTWPRIRASCVHRISGVRAVRRRDRHQHDPRASASSADVDARGRGDLPV